MTMRNRQGVDKKSIIDGDDPIRDVRRSRNRGRRKVNTIVWLQRITIALHFAAIITVVYGIYLRAAFHNGDECEMTYSMRNYVPIHVAEAITTSYNLFKFVDSRDPRHQSLLARANTPIRDNSHCAQNPFVVLYIPGHWGSYSQCRSIGAHGVQLTKSGSDGQFVMMATQALRDGTWSGTAEHSETFVYEVYCVDFAEQGAAVHGIFIRKQSQYVAQVVEKLSKDCGVATITLVGHSVGGLVAKSVPVYHPSVGSKIRNIVTLATPHVGLPFAFDQSIHNVYLELESITNGILITSISGGLKDEMIPAALCEVPSGVSRVAGAAFGMDHKAIVWCSQVLEKVREIIFILSQDETPGRKSVVERVGVVNGSYAHFVAEQKNLYLRQNGFFRYVALEAAMVYNLELLLSMFSLLCGYYLVGPRLSPLGAVGYVAAISVSLSNHHLAVVSVVVLSLLANSIFWWMRLALSFVPNRFSRSDLALRSRAVTAVKEILALTAAVGTFVGVFGFYRRKMPSVQASSLLLVGLFVWLSVAPFTRTNTFDIRSVIFSAFTMIAIPVLAFGNLIVFGWNVWGDFGGEIDVALALKVFAPVAVRFVVGKNVSRNNEQIVCVVAHSLNALAFAPGLLRVGGGYLVGHYLACVALIESVRLLPV
jgi:pimeloyl-ACP methyl ester carboxylesterase